MSEQRVLFRTVMMVCVGNICRSPIAEAYLQHQQPELDVFSSGVGAMVGEPADPYSQELMHAKGIDLSRHRGQQINALLVSGADLILTMERRHISAILAQFPEAIGKVHLLGRWQNNREIPDPYRKSLAEFAIVSGQIESAVDAWREKLWVPH